MLFYAAFREAAIERIVKKGVDMGYSMESENRDELYWFSDRIRKWSIGTIYSSGLPVLVGMLLLIYVVIVFLVSFTVVEMIQTLLIAYIGYQLLIRYAKKNVQMLSFILTFIGLVGTIIGLFLL